MNQAANINSDICTCIPISHSCSFVVVVEWGADGATTADMDLVGGNDSINTPGTYQIHIRSAEYNVQEVIIFKCKTRIASLGSGCTLGN